MGTKNGNGVRFEAEIAQLFRSAGYSVEMNVTLSGQEFDIIAKRHQFGKFFVCFAVECKFRTNGSLSNQDVYNFITAYRSCAEVNGFTFGFIVSNQGFSRAAHEAVRSHPHISLMTTEMLEDELLGARTYLENSKKNYRTDFTNYISLRGTTVSINDVPPAPISDVASHCASRLSDQRRLFTFLLGDFGSGKTTLAEQTHSMLVNAYLTGESEFFPLILYLRTLEQYDTEQEFIEAHLKLSSQEFGLGSLETVASRKKLALILDGFDEVAANASEDERMRLFSRAMRIAARGHSVLLTSRPAYFDNFGELLRLIDGLTARDHAAVHKVQGQRLRRDSGIQSVLDRQQSIALAKLSKGEFPQFNSDATEILVVNPLEKSDIIRFLNPYKDILKRNYRKTPEQIYTFLAGIYDLTDLLTRPLLLDMFVDLLRAKAVDLNSPDMQIGPAGLYSLYINYHLTRDWDKRRFLTPDERLAFARSAAIAMLEAGGSLEATYESVLRLVTAESDILSEERRHLLQTDRTGIVTDVRVCSFMNVTAAGRIEFSHKSFMEYFVADVIAANLKIRSVIELLKRELNYEILYFLGSFALLRSDLRVEILQHKQHVAYGCPPIYRTNLLIALMFSEQVSAGREFWDYEFNRIRIAKKGFDECVFRRVSWRKAAIIDVNFDGCEFEDFQIEGEISGLSFDACVGSITLPSTCNDLSIEGASKLNLMANSSLRSKVIKGVWAYSRAVIGLNLQISQVKLQSVILCIEPNCTIQLRDISYCDCLIYALKVSVDVRALPYIQLHGTSVQGSTIVFLRIRREEFVISEQAFDGARGIVVVDDTDQELIAFRKKDADDATRYHGWDRRDQLILISTRIYVLLTQDERLSIQAKLSKHYDDLEYRISWDVVAVESLIRSAADRMNKSAVAPGV